MTKIQFYAIELARNREGHNDKIRGKFKPKVRGPKKQATEQFSNNLTQEVDKYQRFLEIKQQFLLNMKCF